jgi:O-antigen/teichoic acid export membrane protein
MYSEPVAIEAAAAEPPRVRLRRLLIRGVLGTGGVKAINALLGLALAIILARALGPEGYGNYALVWSIVSLLAIPAAMGLPTLVVREMARLAVQQRWALMRGLLMRANQIVLALNGIICAVSATLAAVLYDVDSMPPQFATFLWGLALLPFLSLGAVRGAALRGLHHVVVGQIPELVLRPALLLVAIVSTVVMAGTLTAPIAMAWHCMAAAFSFVVGAMVLARSLPRGLASVRPEFDTSTWIGSIIPLSFLSGILVINAQTDIVVLGLLGSSQEVGIYRVASQAAHLVVFAQAVVNLAIAPTIARLHASADKIRLQRMVTWSTRCVFLVALPLALVFIAFGERILILAFGEAYKAAYLPLAILSGAQLFNAGMGPVTAVLNMTGLERVTAKGVAVAAAVNIILNVILVPLYGMVGAAIGTAISLLVWNAVLSYEVSRRLGIRSAVAHLGLR